MSVAMQVPSGTVLHVKLCWAPGAEVAVGRLGMRDASRRRIERVLAETRRLGG